MQVQPSGTVTLVFTDIEGSTRLLSELGREHYLEALTEHRQRIRDAFARFDGYEVDYEGDSFFYAFQSASTAVSAVREGMSALEDGPIQVRVGIHSGEPGLDPPKYVGMDVHRAARIMACAHGGQAVLSHATRELLEDPDGLRDLGEHRLKDLSAPVRLYQLGDSEFPPLRSLYRTNLPVPATPFLGRKQELAEVASLLEREDVHVLTLTGPGGTGKTRLALQAAAENGDRYPDGIWWVPLASLRESELLLPTVALVLDVKEQPGRDVSETLAEQLGGRRTLLLLDNVEHLLPEAASAIAQLRNVDGPQLLVTSRERLQLAGEQLYAVPALDDSDAAALFTARARQLDPWFTPAPAVTTLCARLDNLPLAIELAAARTSLFTIEQLLERLAERLDLLKGQRDADPRQQTLRATIDWSYQLLDPEERRVFCALSIFVGGCTLPAAEAICEADTDTLQSLLDKSLLSRREGPLEPRYWMLETIREFASMRRDERQLDLRRQRYVQWFARYASQVSQELGARHAVKWLEAADAEIGNLRAAFALALWQEDEAVIDLGMLLGELHELRGRYAEALETLNATRSRARIPLATAKLDRLLGNVLIRGNDLTGATAAYAAAEELLAEPTNADGTWWREWIELKLNQGTLCYWGGDSAALQAVIEDLRPRIEEHGTARQRADFLNIQMLEAIRRERYVPSDGTEALARAYRDAAEAAGNWDGEFQLAFVLLWRNKLAEARDHFRLGRESARSAGDVLTEIRCLVYETISQRKLGVVESVRSLDAEIAGLGDTYGYDGLIAANRAWLALRERDYEATEHLGAAACAAWEKAPGTASAAFQWSARFPLLAVDVHRDRLSCASEQASFMLDEGQQALAPEIQEILQDAVRTGRSESFRQAIEAAFPYGYT